MTGFLLPPEMPRTDAALRDAVHGSPDSRWVAALALGRETGDQRTQAVSMLTQLMDDDLEEIRAQALEAITEQARQGGRIDGSIVRSALSDPSPAVRCTAIDAALVVLDRPESAVIGRHTDPDPSVRAAVAQALGDIGGDDCIPPLKALLQDDDGFVKLAAAVALAEMGVPDGEAVLLDAIATRSDDACEAARALGLIRSEKAAPLLERLVSRFFGSAELKAMAKVALYRCTDGRLGKTEITQALSSRRHQPIMAMLTALSRLPVAGVTDRVGSLLARSDAMIVSAAIHTLRHLAEADAANVRKCLEKHHVTLSPDLAKERDELLLYLEEK